MSLSIKRSVHVKVTVDASFKKKYLLFASKLVEDLNYRLASYELAGETDESPAYQSFLLAKQNETKLQLAQLTQRMNELKKCKDGDTFRLTVLDGETLLTEGDNVLQALTPVVVETDGATITNIIS